MNSHPFPQLTCYHRHVKIETGRYLLAGGGRRVDVSRLDQRGIFALGDGESPPQVAAGRRRRRIRDSPVRGTEQVAPVLVVGHRERVLVEGETQAADVGRAERQVRQALAEAAKRLHGERVGRLSEEATLEGVLLRDRTFVRRERLHSFVARYGAGAVLVLDRDTARLLLSRADRGLVVHFHRTAKPNRLVVENERQSTVVLTCGCGLD